MSIIQYISKALLSKFTTFQNQDTRSRQATKNILYSFTAKGLGIGISFYVIPLTLRFVSVKEYGFWITISSLITWIAFFDLGMGNGLRNKITANVALGFSFKAKEYISTAYVFITTLSLSLISIFFIIFKTTKWLKFINSGNIEDANRVVILTMIVFSIQFSTQLISTVLASIHKFKELSAITLITQVMTLILLFILLHINLPTHHLLTLSVITGFSPIFIQLVATFRLFGWKIPKYRPNFLLFRFDLLKELLNNSFSFFFIQIGGLILFQTDTFIISRLFGPGAVTGFSLAYKLTSILIMIFTLIVTPYWGAFADAYALKDFAWMKKNYNKLMTYWLVLILPSFVLMVLNKPIFKIWIGKDQAVATGLMLPMILYSILICFLLIQCYLLNGIGKIRIQFFLYVIVAFLNVPLGIWLAKMFGISGVTWSNNITMAVMSIILYIQCQKILNKRAKGLWYQ